MSNERVTVRGYTRRYPGGKKKGTARPGRALPGARKNRKNRKRKATDDEEPRRSKRLKSKQ